MDNAIITLYRRIKLAQITSGYITKLPKIKYIAFGDGGVDSSGNLIAPFENQTQLNNEFCRYEIEDFEFPVETTVRYKVNIPRVEQAGKKFNEMALVDEDGNLCAIKTMYTKQKDEDVIFSFEFDDEF